ncbi:hypothetical protein O0I10_012323 [Lichtheimia ornata]|uniref:Uncharacterized protein n=1 Tax=Lichtheimia ornata TaxID=688661 RepID=A0AAD7USS7_9FUNG|nr:uncharacterized protein O0I10_012323 [Lichtheimia ornata]KAJ8652049.1 hypothetical protein O0I10_012323 [Lichtheimia ornata]
MGGHIKVPIDHLVTVKGKINSLQIIERCYVLRLPAPGMYTAQHIGSIPIPSDVSNLKWLRTKCIPRLMFMRKHAPNAKILSAEATKDHRTKRLKSSTFMQYPTYEVGVRWVRGTWYKPSRPNTKIIIPKNLL